MLAKRTRKWCPQRLTGLSKSHLWNSFQYTMPFSLFDLSLHSGIYQPKWPFLTETYLINLPEISLSHQCILLLHTNYHNLKLFYLFTYLCSILPHQKRSLWCRYFILSVPFQPKYPKQNSKCLALIRIKSNQMIKEEKSTFPVSKNPNSQSSLFFTATVSL